LAHFAITLGFIHHDDRNRFGIILNSVASEKP
jgi:hypothetical protein